MPLTNSGKEILSDFKKRYGRKKGKRFFYAYMEGNPKKTKKWHKVKRHEL